MPQADEKSTVVSTIIDVATRYSDRPFCHHYNKGIGKTISYADLLAASLKAAGKVQALGCERGDIALIFSKHQPDMYYAFIGCMMAGVIPAFMPYPNAKQDSALFWKSHRELLARINPRLLLVSEELVDQFMANLPAYANVVHRIEELDGPVIEPVNFDPEEIAFLQHSSGTTALKKGVMLSHREVTEQIAAYRSSIGFSANDVIASWLPLYHDMGLISCFIQTILTGSMLIALDPLEWVGRPQTLLAAIEKYRATFCWLPNFAFNHIALTSRGEPSVDLSTLRGVISCSEPCKVESFEVFEAKFKAVLPANRLQVCYAMAENVFAVTQSSLDEPYRVLAVDRDTFDREHRAVAGQGQRHLSCGRAIDGVKIRIVADDGGDLADGHVGEIAIRSPFLFSGYYKQPDITAQKLRNGWYHTGDLGFLDDGHLFVTGRKDDLLIAFGRNYYAHEIEQVANGVAGVAPGRTVAFAIPSDMTGTNQIVLAVEPRGEPDEDALKLALLKSIQGGCGLTLHRVVIYPSGSLIKSSSGKIHRTQNRDRYLASL